MINKIKGHEFVEDNARILELQKSTDITDQLTLLMMEPQLGDEADGSGLWYGFARPKAIAIMKRFNVTKKEQDGTNTTECQNS
jgi:hypothetical protein